MTLENKYNGLKLVFKQLIYDGRLEENDVFETVETLSNEDGLGFLTSLNLEIMDELNIEILKEVTPH